MKPMCWTHPKFARLRIRLGTDLATAAGLLEGLWHLTATFEPDTGRVPFTPHELMDWFFLDERRCGFTADDLLQALVDAKFVDCRDGQLYVHDWKDHRPYYLEHRISQKKYRDKHKRTPPVVENVNHGDSRVIDSDVPSASASVSVSEESSSSKNPLKLNTSSSGDDASPKKVPRKKNVYTPEFEAWFKEYPRSEGKFEAAKAYEVASKEVGHDALMKAVRLFAPYGRTLFGRDGKSSCVYASRWLNARRYDDDPSTWKIQPTLPGINGNGHKRELTWEERHAARKEQYGS